MKIIAANGSPRKSSNTATLLKKALDGARSQGAEADLVTLYDLNYRGCISCFACKTKNGPSYGRCATKDDLTPILKKVEEADAILLGSPIYFGSVTGEMKSFMERLLFPYLRYTDPPETLFPHNIRPGLIFTLGATEEMAKQFGIDKYISTTELFVQMTLGKPEILCSYDTYQFDDYSKMDAPRWDPEQKAKVRAEVFPIDCQRAFEMGQRLVKAMD